MALKVPRRLAANCSKRPERAAWLQRLPATLRDLERRWSLILDAPFDSAEVSCAWVAPAARANGTSTILKLGMPRMEGEHELHGLRFWNGNPTVRLLEADDELGAMLLERCEPGTALRGLPESEQDWSGETMQDLEWWPDRGLVPEGPWLFKQLPRTAPIEVLLATDLHAGNVLRSKREPWLVIDPKPFVGDPAYDATQHLFNCSARLHSDPDGTIHRMADLLGVDRERVRLRTFARAAAEPRDDWRNGDSMAIARAIAR